MTTDIDQAQLTCWSLTTTSSVATTRVGSPVPLRGAADSDEEPPHPINWNLLTADEAEAEWLDLNAWVELAARDVRAAADGGPAVLAPPRRTGLGTLRPAHALAQRLRPGGSPSAPLAWHRDFADARNRLREWVSTSGTKLDRDRPTRLTTWPGESRPTPASEVAIEDRDADFVAYVRQDVTARRRIEDRARATARAS